MKKLPEEKMNEHRGNIPTLGIEETKTFLSSLHHSTICEEQKEELKALCDENFTPDADPAEAQVVTAGFDI